MSSRSASPKHTRKAARRLNEAKAAKVARRLVWQQIIALTCFVIALCGAALALQHSPDIASASGDGIEGTVKAGVADGYFSGLDAGDTPVATDSWASTRRIVFGKQKDSDSSTAGTTYGNYQVSGGYKTLAVGPLPSVFGVSYASTTIPMTDDTASSTTSVETNDALLWADDVVTAGFKFDARETCATEPNSSIAQCKNDFDSGDVDTGYKSNAALVSVNVANQNYSTFEQGLLREAKIEGVCTLAAGCGSGKEPTDTLFSPSINKYKVFPLSIGDTNKFLGHTIKQNGAVAEYCRRVTIAQEGFPYVKYTCGNGANGSWLRSYWTSTHGVFEIRYDGRINNNFAAYATEGLQPALRLKLDNLLLSADSSNQSQLASTVTDADKDKSLQLTFVDENKQVTSTDKPKVTVARSGDDRVLNFAGGSSNLANATGWGWKLMDSQKTTAVSDDVVVASGKSNAGGNLTLPASLDVEKSYVLYYWHQKDGTAENGWTNEATVPLQSPLYLVEYHLNDGTNHADNPGGWVAASASDITLKPATKSGYTFRGWYDNAQFTGSRVTKISASATTSYVLYAKFTPLLDLGPDGYFHEMDEGEKPMRAIASEANARKVLFGRSGSLANAATLVESGDAATAQVDGKYLALGKGANTTSVNRSPRSTSESDTWAWSKTTQLAANEVLLWSDDVVTTPFTFAASSSCSEYPCNTFDAGTANDGKASYESYVATVSRQLGSDTYYSDVELNQMGAATQLSGVCTKGGTTGCNSGYATDQSTSVGSYRVFPLSTGDMAEYFNANDGFNSADNAKRQCSGDSCTNSASGSWLRSASWDYAGSAFNAWRNGGPYIFSTDDSSLGLRPALRLELGDLVLSADSQDQSQLSATVTDADKDKSLRLTFVDADKSIADGSLPSISVERSGDKRKIAIDGGSSDFAAEQTGWGWKMFDPGTKADDTSDDVVNQSGRSNKDVATDTDGNMTLPSSVTNGTTYNLYAWGQVDGSAENGWSNRATTPYKTTVSLVDYHLDGGTNNADNPVGWVGKSASEVTLKAATRSGYKFLGWYDAAAGGEKVTKIPADSTQSYVLYAHWQELDLGPDGYYSTLKAGALPVVEADAATAEVQDGWANVRRILFGKQGTTGTYGGASVSGGYKTLAKGAVASVEDANTFSDYGDVAYTKSATTSVAENEALLWADDVVTAGIKFADGTSCGGNPCNSFDSAGYKSNLATVSDAVGAANYSSFEQGLLRAAQVEGVCTAAQTTGCSSGSYTSQSDSVNDYKVFPLSVGDLNKFVGTTTDWVSPGDPNLACKTYIDVNNSDTCANGTLGTWLRSADWGVGYLAFVARKDGFPDRWNIGGTGSGLRPALRLELGSLVLSAAVSNQSQSKEGDLQLTFVEDDQEILKKPDVSVVRDSGKSKLKFSGFDASSTTFGSAQTGWGWKLVDTTDNAVIASGKSNDGGNLVLPDSYNASHDYTLYYWGQDDGAAEDGWSNRATDVVATSIDVKPIDAHVVQYELHGGENDPANPTIWLDKLPDTVVLQPATRLGYKFLGWFDQETDGNEVTELAKDRNTNIILHARWELQPATSLPFTGSWPLWWWLLIAVVLVAGCFTVLGRHRALNGFAVGYSLKHDGMRRDFSCPRHRRW